MKNTCTDCDTKNETKEQCNRMRVLLVGPTLHPDDIGGTKVSFSHLVEDFPKSGSVKIHVVDTSRLVSKRKGLRHHLLKRVMGIKVVFQRTWRMLFSDIIMVNAAPLCVFVGTNP